MLNVVVALQLQFICCPFANFCPYTNRFSYICIRQRYIYIYVYVCTYLARPVTTLFQLSLANRVSLLINVWFVFGDQQTVRRRVAFLSYSAKFCTINYLSCTRIFPTIPFPCVFQKFIHSLALIQINIKNKSFGTDYEKEFVAWSLVHQ